jgi:transposase
MILARLPEIGALDRRKIAALVGVAPITCKSGSSINRASIAGGRKPMRDTLFMAALSASSHNSTFIALRQAQSQRQTAQAHHRRHHPKTHRHSQPNDQSQDTLQTSLDLKTR